MSVEQAVPPQLDAPRRPTPRWRRMLPPVLVAAPIAAATLALHLRDPHDQGSWGQCPSAAMGIWCPGCGGLRAVNDLSNGRILDAASSHLVFVLTLPVLGYIFVRWSVARWQGRPWEPPQWAVNTGIATLMVALVVFTVLRNLPAGSWLAP